MYMKEVSTSNFLFLIACCIELLSLHIFVTQLSNIKEVSSRHVMFFIACCIEAYNSSLCTYVLLTQLSNIKAVSTGNVMFLIGYILYSPYGSSISTFS